MARRKGINLPEAQNEGSICRNCSMDDVILVKVTLLWADCASAREGVPMLFSQALPRSSFVGYHKLCVLMGQLHLKLIIEAKSFNVH
jgi:hypothetical protein